MTCKAEKMKICCRSFPSVGKVSAGRFCRRVRRLESGCRPTIALYARLLQIRVVLNSYCGHLCHFKGYRVLDARFGRSPLKRFFDFSRDCRKSVLRKESVSVNMPFENKICYEERYDASKERL